MEHDLRDRVRYEARDGRAYITFCRDEKRNALTYEMFDRLMEHIDTAERDDDVRVIIFRSEGRDFSTGHDLAQVGGAEYGFSKDPKARRPSQRARLHFDKRHVEQFRQIFYCVKPTLSLVQGWCVGAGLYIVEASDLAIAARDAKIGHPEQKMGLAGAAYLTSWNILAMGPRKAREMLLLGEVVDGEEAARIGLINKAVAPEELAAAGEEWAERIVRLPRDAIAIGKAATHLAMDSLGMTSQFVHGYIGHALGTNIRYEPDEVNFMKERRDKGTTQAAHTREKHYDESASAKPADAASE
ncbi:enoyl-CoA hydratase/isomerase family protein [Pseudomonas sp. RIT-PI-AD]|uniref:enoyl-CoA hydratase/isomerase family protein n=1 Tax=Pseudomonas sp. RIT-PI-AD TaxID=3035294 RepID=UPI0021DB494F|nr:enoyl-CoA hydratase/isomerase family protein [Pseudomonas sp. RIT-PI-AD]